MLRVSRAEKKGICVCMCVMWSIAFEQSSEQAKKKSKYRDVMKMLDIYPLYVQNVHLRQPLPSALLLR